VTEFKQVKCSWRQFTGKHKLQQHDKMTPWKIPRMMVREYYTLYLTTHWFY